MKQKYFQILIALVIFAIAALAYFSPVLKGEQLFQSDIMQFKGVSKEIVDYREQTGEEPYWTNRVFGGMPAYVVSAKYPHNYIKKLDSLIRFLPRPADYVFLYFLSFFVLLTVLNVDWRLSILGALAFGFSTYLIIIFGAGHNAKAHAIAYMPLVLAGMIAIFRKKYLLGFVLTSLSMALEITANHPQMTYYLLFMILILGIVFLVDAYREKELPHFFKSVGIAFIAVVVAVGVNATSLMATKEYSNYSTRSKSELTFHPDGSKKEEISGGLDKEYITQYSYGIPETFNLLIPRFYGGGSRENLGTDTETYHFLKDKIGRQQARSFTEGIPAYWGDQPIVEAPAYVGAVLIFLFVLGLFIVKGRLKKWLFAAVTFSILLSWGKNFSVLTDFFIDYVPLYNKFRAVSSIQVIAEVAVPLLAILALQKVFKSDKKEDYIKYLKYSLYIVGGFTLLFTLAGTSLFNFESFRDPGLEQQLPGITDAIIADRKSIFFRDSLRSLLLIFASGGILWAFVKDKLSNTVFIAGFALLILFDLVGVDRRYVNADDFISKSRSERPFNITELDKEILQDKSYYRVADFSVDPMNDGSTSYLYNSIGGYHAAKPRRYEELFNYQIAKNNFEILNMLNVKYIKFPDNQGNIQVQQNSDANGNVWFVEKLKSVTSADEEMKALDSLNSKQEAVINTTFLDTDIPFSYQNDSTATIRMTSYQPNELVYESETATVQFAVFSDIYYKDGWNAYIDGEPTPYFNVNYVLRGMVVPSGNHKITFRFEPAVIVKGSTITLASYAFLLLIPIGWVFLKRNHK